MALYNRGVLPPNASATSRAYATAASQNYQASLQPERTQALQELADEYSGRGLSPSGGQAIQARSLSTNDFLSRLSQHRQQLGVQQAQQQEQQRQATEGRGWEREDMAKEQALKDELMNWNKEDYNAERQRAPVKALFGGLGRIGGAGAASLMSKNDNTAVLNGGGQQQRANYGGGQY